ncbi:MAG: 5-carboxymethyl-2-hydroxymuconate semialdehyde dehydrogenase [Armatimonadota bacterium]|nr:5-carboxymethyl-2-hydroxymuconate semialdehyde dehydrogenase [Armatimonadota bacterium]MDR7593316.1 5-carboxymethyl-2-hydroxymuconate semialdehyde dehydrogenase [Armatimonadota bacterium]
MQVLPGLETARHYIDGRFTDGVRGETFPTLNPATNEPLARVAAGTPEDVDRAVQAARRAFDEGPWPRLPAADRARILRRIADVIERRADEIARVEVLDTGIPLTQIRQGQVLRAADNFRFFAEMATRIPTEAYPKDGEFLNYVRRVPVGVVGLITPWNTPFMLETWKLAPCLAAGCTCVLKPAEWAPLSAVRLVEAVQEAGVPPGVVNLVHGIGEVAGAALVAHPGVNAISFTGETTTGMEILRTGAATLKRFSMELGGKSPVLVFPDADLERALDAVLVGVYTLNGERCTANSRLLVHESIADAFVERLVRRVAALRLGDPLDPATEVGPLIHPDHWERVHGYVRLGEAEGAHLATGGRRPAGLPQGNYLEPAVFTDVRPAMRIFQEEIFGPVLVVTRFRDEAEAVRLANAVRYGLAAYVWTGDVARAHRVAHALEAGMVWVNSHNVRDLRTPFGGMKHSGIGREGGHYSFDFFMEYQTVHVALGTHRIPRLGTGEPLRPTDVRRLGG